MRLAVGLVAIALAAGTGLLAAEPEPLTKLTVRAMPTEVLNRRLFGDLGSILLPYFSLGRPNVRPVEPLRTLEFLTIAHATSPEAGLCESTEVIVRFEPAGPVHGADTEVRPARLESATQYFVSDRRRVRTTAPFDEAEHERLEADCRRIDPRTRNLFSARRSDFALRGLRLVLDLVEAARDRRLAAPLDCTGMAPPGAPPLTAPACLRTVARLDPDHLLAVGICGDAIDIPVLCYWASIDGITLHFVLSQDETIERVALSQDIIVVESYSD